jgi:general secretion pathway protein C
MLIVLHSYYRPICLTLLAILGLACGHLVDTVLQMNLRPEVASETAIVQTIARKSLRTSEADLDLILQKNIFDANNRSAAARMGLVPMDADGEESAAAPRADIKLFGTVVAGENSQVLLQVGRELQLYHLGEQIAGGGTIEEIQRNQVTIRNRDKSLMTLMLYEQASLESGDAPSETRSDTKSDTSRAVKPGSALAKSSGKDTESAGDIRSVGENRWLISKDVVESVRENFSAQLRLAQMQPRLVDGKTDGFLIQRINPRSLLAKMGMLRGDVIIDVNSIKLDSPEKALMIFQQLREARQISVAVERNGKPINLAYEIE